MGPGCEQLAYVAANPQTPPSRPHHCEDPPVLPSVKGSPLRMEEQGGGPQEMAFVRAAAGWFRAQRQGRAGASRPHPKTIPPGYELPPH